MVELVIAGRPITKKNHSQLFRGRLLPSPQYRKYAALALQQLGRNKKGIDSWVEVRCLYYMPNRSGWPDLIGLLQATSDILETCKVIENDRQIVSYDGSKIAGIDKDNPRVEISIREVKAPWLKLES